MDSNLEAFSYNPAHGSFAADGSTYGGESGAVNSVWRRRAAVRETELALATLVLDAYPPTMKVT